MLFRSKFLLFPSHDTWSRFFTKEEEKEVMRAVNENSGKTVTEIKEILNESIDYFKIRAIIMKNRNG